MSQSGAPPEPRRSDAARNRQRLLDAAAEVFAAHGTKASLRDVAERAGLGIGTVYRHMPDKDAVLVVLLRPQLQQLTAVAKDALAQEDPCASFIWLMEQTSAAMADSRALTELLVTPGPVPSELRGHVSEVLILVGRLLERAQQTGGIRADLATTDLPMILAAVHTTEQTFGLLSPGIYRRILAILIDGVRAPGEHQLSSLAAPPVALEDLVRGPTYVEPR